MPWEDPRHLLRRHGLEPKKAWSQNFLVSRSAVDRIVAAAAPWEGRSVIELGPGPGTLTHALLDAGATVVALERDRDMVRVLREELGEHPRLEVVEGDAADADLAPWARPDVIVVGNLPYAITGSILRNLVGQRALVRRAVLMVQREVRDRLLAAPATKTYGALTVFLTAAFRVEPVMVLRPGAFHPPPKVASAVVRLEPHPSPRAEETAELVTVVRAAFDARRKTLRNALRYAGPASRVDAALEAAGIDPRRRGETLSVEEFGRLAHHWAGTA